MSQDGMMLGFNMRERKKSIALNCREFFRGGARRPCRVAWSDSMSELLYRFAAKRLGWISEFIKVAALRMIFAPSFL